MTSQLAADIIQHSGLPDGLPSSPIAVACSTFCKVMGLLSNLGTVESRKNTALCFAREESKMELVSFNDMCEQAAAYAELLHTQMKALGEEIESIVAAAIPAHAPQTDLRFLELQLAAIDDEVEALEKRIGELNDTREEVYERVVTHEQEIKGHRAEATASTRAQTASKRVTLSQLKAEFNIVQTARQFAAI